MENDSLFHKLLENWISKLVCKTMDFHLYLYLMQKLIDHASTYNLIDHASILVQCLTLNYVEENRSKCVRQRGLRYGTKNTNRNITDALDFIKMKFFCCIKATIEKLKDFYEMQKDICKSHIQQRPCISI